MEATDFNLRKYLYQNTSVKRISPLKTSKWILGKQKGKTTANLYPAYDLKQIEQPEMEKPDSPQVLISEKMKYLFVPAKCRDRTWSEGPEKGPI